VADLLVADLLEEMDILRTSIRQTGPDAMP